MEIIPELWAPYRMRKELIMRVGLPLFVLIIMALGTTANAKVVTEAVSYLHRDVQLEGYLAYDDSSKDKRPGILIVHEWWGLNAYVRGRAEQLAAMGYVAFALDMYGKGKVTQHPNEAGEWSNQIISNVHLWQQRALAGLEVLKKHSGTYSERLAAIGYCFGGATVQQLAYSGADIRGVVSFHGSLVSPGKIIVKEVKAKILLCHGADDPFAEPQTIIQYIDAMKVSGLDWQMIFYGGVRHGFTNPEADKVGLAALKYSKSADERSWGHMNLFFEEIFRLK
jgi:dienelactone hydrolase